MRKLVRAFLWVMMGVIMVVHFEDGRNVKFPDGMDDAAVAAACRKIAIPLQEPTPPPKGAPVDFGGQVVSNPKNAQVRLDTEPPLTDDSRIDVPMQTDPYFKGDSGMSTENPPAPPLHPAPTVREQ